ncbi:MAG: hydroxymethylbilane synthase [Lachnospiraceae bacterium]|nr:hydroxymethylbilane synthase [Lachnospiraceae bacterium]
MKVGTRGSRLALEQTDEFIRRFSGLFPDVNIMRSVVTTHGDKDTQGSLDSFGGKGVFTDELEDALNSKNINLAVHSAKDLPMELCDGNSILCVLPRADPRDVLVVNKDTGEELSHITIGTGSSRRIAQFHEILPEANIIPIRGNVTTRYNKITRHEIDAAVLAAAGLDRLGLLKGMQYCDSSIAEFAASSMKNITTEDIDVYENDGKILVFFSADRIIPAGGQGIIAVEGGEDYRTMLARINDQDTYKAFLAERYMLKLMNAGCSEPAGVYADVNDGIIKMRVMKENNGKIFKTMAFGNADYKVFCEKLFDANRKNL